jgi:phage-related protein
MAGINVGSVSVTVVPDASNFGPDLRAKVVPPASSVGDEIGRQLGAPIASRVGDAVLRGMSDGSGRASGAAAAGGDSSGGAFADAFKRRVQAALAALPDVKIDADSSDADRKLADLRAELEELSSKQVGVDISDADAKAKLDELKASLDDLGRKSESVRIKVDTAAASAELAKFKAEADAATSSVNSSGGAGGIFSAIGASANEASSNIGGMVAAIATLGPALIPLGAVAAGSLAALPAILGGVGAGASALVLGLSGVPKAVEAVAAAQDTAGKSAAQLNTAHTNLAVAMGALTPAGRSFVTFVGTDLLPVFDRLKASAQTALLPGLDTALRTMLPVFAGISPFITAAAKGIGDFAQNLASFLASPTGLGELNTILGEGTGFMRNMGAAALDGVKAFGALGAQAAPIVDALGASAHNVARALLNWSTDGGAAKFVAFAEQSLPLVGRLLDDVGSAVAHIVEALAPLGTAVTFGLDSLVSALGRIPSGSLAGIAGAIGGIVAGLKLFDVGPLGIVVSALVGMGGAAAPLQTLRPILGDVSKVMGDLGTAIQPIIGAAGQALKAIVGALQPLFAQMEPVIAKLADTLGHGLGQVLVTLTPPLTTIAKTLGGVLLDAVRALAPVMPVFVGALQVMASAVAAIPQPVLSALVVGIAGIAVAVKAWSLAQAILNTVLDANPIVLIGVAVAGLGVVIYELVDHWSAVWAEITKLTSDAWKAITGAFTDAWNWLEGFFKDYWPLIAGLLLGPIALAVGEIVQHWSTIKGAFSDAWKWVSKTFSALWSDAKSGVGAIITKPVSDAVNAITGVFGPKGPLQGAFRAMWGWVSGTFKGLWSDGKSGVGAIITGPMTGLAGVVTGIWGDIKRAFVNGVNDVIGLIDAFIDAIDRVTSAVGLGNLIHPIDPISTGATRSSNPGFMGPLPAHAAGGVLPGYAPGQDSVLSLLSPGEAVLRPEVARWLGADTIHGWNAAAVKGTLPGFSDGGIVGDITGAVSSVKGAIGGALGDATSILRRLAADGAAAILGPFHNAADTALRAVGGPIGQIGVGVSDKVYRAVLGLISGHQAKQGGGFGTVGAVTGSGMQAVWSALRSAGMTAAQAAGVMGNMQSESGFNPWIIQGGGTSTNPAAAGSGGYGLVQWTPGAKLVPYLHGQLPSVASEVGALVAQLDGVGPSPEGAAGAALRAATSPMAAADIFGLKYERYAGPPQAGRAAQAAAIYDQFKGYDEGGWLQPGLNWNGTGAPEPVLTIPQWDTLKNGVAGTADLAGKLDRVISLLEANPDRTGELVSAGVSGEFQRAAIAHADRSLMNARTR